MAIGKYERKDYKVTCSVCGKEYIVKQIKGSECKQCQKKRHDKKYRDKNIEKITVQTKKYREENREKLRQRHNEYYYKNKEKIAAKSKKYYRKHKDEIIAKQASIRRKQGVKEYGSTPVEKIVLDTISSLFPHNEIICHDRKTIKSTKTGRFLELDFYIPSLKLAVELNGAVHNEPVFGQERYNRQVENDQIKRDVCKSIGITLIEIETQSGKHYERFEKERNELRDLVKIHLEKYRRLNDE